MKSARLLLLSAAMTTAACAAPDYSAVIPRFEAAVREEMAAWEIEGISTAWVDGTQTVYEAGFGEAKADSVFRCGSVSKLFNAVSVMQLAEAGKLDLDAPVERYAPGLVPVNPFPGTPPVTLRLLLCHRSGLQRESSVGSYFDDTDPGVLKSVESLRGNALVTAPNAKTRYSNIGPTLAGHCVETASGQTFEKYQEEHLLKPLGMTRSAWRARDLPEGVTCLRSHIRVADGKGGFPRRGTPLFDLGTIPAGNLFTTAGDLAKFIAMLASDGDAPGGRVLRPGSLAQMWKPQIEDKGSYGLAFVPGEFRGRRSVGHNGAVYGHSTMLLYLPEEKIGVVVIANEDIVNARPSRLGSLALSLMLEAKLGEKAPVREPVRLSAEALAAFAGNYESQSFWTEVVADAAAGGLKGNYASQPCVFIPAGGDTFLLRSRLHDDVTVGFVRDGTGKVTGFSAGPQVFTRVPEKTAPAPESWKILCGSYGPEVIPVIIFEKFGHLYASTENMVDYRLTPVTRHLFSMPLGLYTDEHLVFHVGPDGKPVAAELASMMLPRR